MTTQAQHPTVAVGVDGSPGSIEAVRWAAHYAQMSSGSLLAITTWSYPADYGWAAIIPGDDLAEDARKRLENTMAKVHVENPEVSIEEKVIQGSAAIILVEASETADLLVVGSRGHGGFAGLVLGSVSAHCVHHSRCPVVVVHATPTEPSPQKQ